MKAELRYYPEDCCYRIEFKGSRKLLKPCTMSVIWVSSEYLDLLKNGELLPTLLEPDCTYTVKIITMKKMKNGGINKLRVEVINKMVVYGAFPGGIDSSFTSSAYTDTSARINITW